MSLSIETKDRKLGPVTDGEMQYNMALTCMVIGIGHVNEKNVREAQARIDLINVMDKFTWSKPSINFTGKDLEGVRTNVTNETRKKWGARIAENFLNARERALT